MSTPIAIAPSILAADFSRLGDAIAQVANDVDMIHIDVMDGHFVPNISLGIPVIRSIRPVTGVPFDCHLMITNPEYYLEALAGAGANMVTVHIEAHPEPGPVAAQAEELGLAFGLAINPGTPVAAIEPFLETCSMVLVMSVQPGFGGQSFMSEVLPKVGEIKKSLELAGHEADIQIDGGITASTIRDARNAGVDVFVAGSAIFGADDPVEAIQELRRVAEGVHDNQPTTENA